MTAPRTTGRLLRALLAAAAAVTVAVTGAVQPARATVGPPLDGFSIETVPYYGYAAVGALTNVTQAVTGLVGPEESISFDLAGMPSGTTWFFSPSVVTSGGSTWVYVDTPVGTPSGFYPVTVIGYGETTTRTTQFIFVVP